MEILDTLYELEGLLLLTKERGGITPEFKSLIEAKARKILRMIEDSGNEKSKEKNEEEEPQSITSEPQPASPEPQAVSPEPQTASPEPQTASPEPQTVSPEPQTKPRRLRLALNDRIRFSRTLFSGDSEALDRSLAYVESLPEREDVEDYFFSEIGWDPTDRETAEFVEMVLFLHSRLI